MDPKLFIKLAEAFRCTFTATSLNMGNKVADEKSRPTFNMKLAITPVWYYLFPLNVTQTFYISLGRPRKLFLFIDFICEPVSDCQQTIVICNITLFQSHVKFSLRTFHTFTSTPSGLKSPAPLIVC